MLSMIVLAAGLMGLEPQVQPLPQASPDRQAAVARVGAVVMPFDLNRTVHDFAPVPSGGIQTVVSDDGDPRKIALIRDHLRVEAVRFSRGEFGSPAAIHGEDMPGLGTLRSHAADIEVGYRDLPQGGELRFTTSDETLIQAIHTWFAAQVSDHGAHAMAGEHNHD